MKFIVVTIEWMSTHGLTPLPTMRKSKDGSKVILHEDYFNLVANRDKEGNLLLEGAEVYAHNSVELQSLLNSEEWSYSEEEAPTESADFIQVAAVRNLMAATKAGIQTMNLTDNEALEVKDMYPEWSDLIGQQVNVDFKFVYENILYKVLQQHTLQEQWIPGIDTASLYTVISANAQEEHTGTKEDPIPYVQNMILEKGKYYTQDGVLYICIQSTLTGYPNDLKDLASIVQKVEE